MLGTYSVERQLEELASIESGAQDDSPKPAPTQAAPTTKAIGYNSTGISVHISKLPHSDCFTDLEDRIGRSAISRASVEYLEGLTSLLFPPLDSWVLNLFPTFRPKLPRARESGVDRTKADWAWFVAGRATVRDAVLIADGNMVVCVYE